MVFADFPETLEGLSSQLAEHIAGDLGDKPDAIRPHIAMVDEALTFLQGGLDALRRRR